MDNDMKNNTRRKTYFLTTLLLVIGAVFFLNIKNPPASTSNSINQTVISLPEVKRIAPQPKTATQTISSLSSSKSPDTLLSTANETSRKEIVTDDMYTASNEEELLAENPNMLAVGEFSDQINLRDEDSNCGESCANNLNANIPAGGEFADQIDADTILQQAMLKNPDLHVPAKLTEASPDSHPSTEFGVYTPPQQ